MKWNSVDTSGMHLGTWSSKSRIFVKNRKKGAFVGFCLFGGGTKTVLTFESSRDVRIQMLSSQDG